MPKIAVSYRRADSSAITGRIFDRLIAHYGEQSVFMDVDNIPVGSDFRLHVHKTLRQADVLLAVIGPEWMGTDENGASRIKESGDPVRVEIETALEHKASIIPVLVDGGKMPSSRLLPDSFGNFAYLNAAEVSSGRDFRAQMDRLIKAIDRVVAPSASTEHFTSAPPKAVSTGIVGQNASSTKSPFADAARYFVVPLVLLVVAHQVIVNAFDLNTVYLWIACLAVPLFAGFALSWVGKKGVPTALLFALALGLVSVGAMIISQSWNSGDPILPQNRGEWRDDVQYVLAIALSFLAGHALDRSLSFIRR